MGWRLRPNVAKGEADLVFDHDLRRNSRAMIFENIVAMHRLQKTQVGAKRVKYATKIQNSNL